jgi:hypothetical protein
MDFGVRSRVVCFSETVDSYLVGLCQSFGDSEVVNVVYAILILIERLVKFWVLIEM